MVDISMLPPTRFNTANSNITMNGTLLNTPMASKAMICRHWCQAVAREKRAAVRGSVRGVGVEAAAPAATWGGRAVVKMKPEAKLRTKSTMSVEPAI